MICEYCGTSSHHKDAVDCRKCGAGLVGGVDPVNNQADRTSMLGQFTIDPDVDAALDRYGPQHRVRYMQALADWGVMADTRWACGDGSHGF